MAKIDLGDLLTEFTLAPIDFHADEDEERERRPSLIHPHYFLFLLGTDTTFVTEPTQHLPKGTAGRRDYKRGETLSYAARVVAQLKGETPLIDLTQSPSPFRSESVAVLNGPTTRGTEVGNRIAWALFLVLRAVLDGKQSLQLTAHSRGAVEAILLMHELERVSQCISDCPGKSLLDIFSETPCRYTKAAVRELFVDTTLASVDQTLFRRELSRRLASLQINAFLIDPVPGESVLGFGGWDDPRFSKKPRCERAELLLYRDERSAYFVPIVPEGIQATIIPGHHGSGSGNQYDQQSRKPWKTARDIKWSTKGCTTTVQNLVLCKLLHFWNEAQVIPPGGLCGIDLGHPGLTTVLNTYLEADNKHAILLQQYDAVHENDRFYRQFANGSYAWVGRVTSLDQKHRLVHFREQRNESMAVLESTSQIHFVNTEHAARYLQGLISDLVPTIDPVAGCKSASEIASDVTVLLQGIVSSIIEPIDTALCEALNTPIARIVLFEAISMRTELVSQKYLRNHLGLAEKTVLMEAITTSFSSLLTAKASLAEQPESESVLLKRAIIDECQSKLQDSLKETIESHGQWLKQESKHLRCHIDLFLHPERFNEAWSQSLQDLNRIPELQSLVSTLSVLNPVTISAAEALLLDHSGTVNELNAVVKEQVYLILDKVRIHFDVHKNDMGHYLRNIKQFYDAVTSLQHVYPVLKELIGTKGLSVTESDLHCLSLEHIQQEEALLKKNETPLLPAESEKNVFTYNKLILLTDHYLEHLLKKARKHCFNIDSKRLDQTLPGLPNNAAYEGIKIKYEKVRVLRQLLTNKTGCPSQHLQAFKNTLLGYDKDLKRHRDSNWTVYAKACLIIIASLFTGIIPALVYSAATRRSPLFFSQSHGARFINACTENLTLPL